MTEPEEKPERPFALLRGVLSVWLLGWGVLMAFFLKLQFSSNPLFNWPMAVIWFGLSVLGWIVVYRVLRRLRRLPPE